MLVSAYVVHRIDQETVLSHGLVGYVRLATQKIDALVVENLVHDERYGGALNMGGRTRGTELHLDPDVQPHEVFHSIEVPGVDVYVVDGRSEDEDPIQLTHTVCREIHSNAVEKSMLQTLPGRVHTHVKY